MSSTSKILCKHELLMYTLTDFFTEEENLKRFLPIINGKSKISLRIIDWFVTNYAKKYNTSYYLTQEDSIKQFIVYLNYKSQLKAYSKKQFDPFCRRERINFYYNDTDFIVTTVGQLNFFRWAISNGIIEYIKQNLKNIEQDMNKSYKAIYKIGKKAHNSRRKRQELSVSATRTVNKHNVKIVVAFD